MPIPVLALITAGLIGGSYLKLKGKEMSVQQRTIYEAALVDLRDPDKLRKLADAYEREGFRAEADLLYKRAALKDLPKDVIKARKEAFHRGMVSQNKEAVLKLAEAYEQEGGTDAAAKLRKHAEEIIETVTPIPEESNADSDTSRAG